MISLMVVEVEWRWWEVIIIKVVPREEGVAYTTDNHKNTNHAFNIHCVHLSEIERYGRSKIL